MTAHASIDVTRVSLEAILGLREEYRREMNCQIVHDSWHARGFTTSYLLRVYAESRLTGRRSPLRGSALPLFRRLVAASGARAIEAQTNDVLRHLYDEVCS